MFAILTAMPGEISATRGVLGNTDDGSFAGRAVLLGKLDKKDVVIGHTGVGKTLSAMTVQGVIDRYRPAALVFTGIAGSLNPSYTIGDIVIAKDCLQHDFDASAVGFTRGEISGEGIFELACSPRLVDYALQWKPAGREVHLGRILSGDQIIVSAGSSSSLYLAGELHGDAVDMESAAAALVAHLNGIPFLLMRIISDNADGVMPGGFRRFLRKSSRLILEFARYMVSFPAAPGGE